MDPSCIQVMVFDDRLEVTSPGMLYGGLTVELIKTGKSKIRNKAIAEVFAQMGIIEAWGTGIQRIIDSCLKMNIKEPLFEELGDSFRVTIFRPTQQKKTPIGKTITTNEEIVINEMAIKKFLSRAEIEHVTKLSKTASYNLINSMIAKGLIKKKGKGKATHYVLSDTSQK